MQKKYKLEIYRRLVKYILFFISLYIIISFVTISDIELNANTFVICMIASILFGCIDLYIPIVGYHFI